VHNRATAKKTIDGVDPINSSTLCVIGVEGACPGVPQIAEIEKFSTGGWRF